MTIVEFVHSRIIEILVAAVKLESKKYHIPAGQKHAGKRYCPDLTDRHESRTTSIIGTIMLVHCTMP